MSERPILFSGEMVRAILDGTKTQTRRLIKPQPEPLSQHLPMPVGEIRKWTRAAKKRGHKIIDARAQVLRPRCPYGEGSGNRLWVRETWQSDDHGRVAYKASEDTWPTHTRVTDGSGWVNWRWRPSIHMPRLASRITLEVTGVRVERLQDIGEDDAKAESAECPAIDLYPENCGCYAQPDDVTNRWHFHLLWDSINANCAPWSSNPWVWVIEFKVVPRG